MSNTQLATLLARTPLSDEDKHNITVIFDALNNERQQKILDTWDVCSGRLISERRKLDYKRECEIIDLLKGLNTYLDEAKIRSQQAEEQKQEKKQQVRQELESTIAYEQMQRLRKIKQIREEQKQKDPLLEIS